MRRALALALALAAAPAWGQNIGGGLNVPGGGATVGGSNTQLQYNNSGALGGMTGATTSGGAITLVAPILGTPASGTLTNATGLPISTGVSGLGTGVATALGIASSGSGGPCLITSCVMVTPALGTPASGTLTNATGLPISTGVSGLGTGVATALGIAVSGSGGPCLITSCVMVTPTLGVTTISGVGASSTAATLWTGLPFVGTGTTSFPLLFIQPTGGTPPTAGTAWSTSGTVLGMNLHTGTLGMFIDTQIDGASKFSVSSTGSVVTAAGVQVAGGSTYLFNGRGAISSPAAGKIQLGNPDGASPTAQFFKFQNVVAGTTDTAGADARIEGSQGTGTGIGGKLIFATAPAAASTNTTQNAEQDVLALDQKSHAKWTSAAIPTIGTCGTGSPTVTAGSTDTAGQFTVGTTATACTLTFKQTYATAPFCVVNDQTVMANITSFTISTTAIVLTMTSNSGNLVQYMCFGA